MRMIDADALIDDLEYDVDLDARALDNLDLDEVRKAIVQFDMDCKKNAIDLLRNAPTIKPEPQWIPCSERLPEKYGNYLVTTDDGEVDIGSCDPENKDRQDHFWGGCDADGFFWYGENIVIAWMKLPEPYQGEGEQDEIDRC